jgi:hypothetical protein
MSVLGERGPHANADWQPSKANPIPFETNAAPYSQRIT